LHKPAARQSKKPGRRLGADFLDEMPVMLEELGENGHYPG
jgi:hypothetical protein